MKSVAELLKVQMQAVTKAASFQSLPPLDTYTGKRSQAEDDGIDRWLDRWLEWFTKRAHLAKWSNEVKLYQLKIHLNKTALDLHIFRMFLRKSPATKMQQTLFVRDSVQYIQKNYKVWNSTEKFKKMNQLWSSWDLNYDVLVGEPFFPPLKT